jgi:hypothetical protein
VDEWPIIEKRIPSMDLVFRPMVDQTAIEVGAAGGDDLPGGMADPKRSASVSSRIRLTPDEERIFRKVDGSRTVQLIIDITGAPEFDVCRTLFDLLNRNIIAPAGRGESRESLTLDTSLPAAALPGYLALVVVMAVALVGTYAQLETPFGISGLRPLLQTTGGRLLDGVNEARLHRIDRAVRAWTLATGQVPRALDVLVEGGLLERPALLDPWSRPYHYVPGPNGYSLSAVDERGREVPRTVIRRSVADRS